MQHLFLGYEVSCSTLAKTNNLSQEVLMEIYNNNIYADELDFDEIIKNTKLTENFIVKLIDKNFIKINNYLFRILVKYQNISEELILNICKNKPGLYIDSIWKYRKFSLEFINSLNNFKKQKKQKPRLISCGIMETISESGNNNDEERWYYENKMLEKNNSAEYDYLPEEDKLVEQYYGII